MKTKNYVRFVWCFVLKWLASVAIGNQEVYDLQNKNEVLS